MDRLMALSIDKGVPMASLPQVRTATTMQGDEADVIIYDLTLSPVGHRSDLGIQ